VYIWGCTPPQTTPEKDQGWIKAHLWGWGVWIFSGTTQYGINMGFLVVMVFSSELITEWDKCY
jgi:hypothetical protein